MRGAARPTVPRRVGCSCRWCCDNLADSQWHGGRCQARTVAWGCRWRQRLGSFKIRDVGTRGITRRCRASLCEATRPYDFVAKSLKASGPSRAKAKAFGRFSRAHTCHRWWCCLTTPALCQASCSLANFLVHLLPVMATLRNGVKRLQRWKRFLHTAGHVSAQGVQAELLHL